ERVGYRREVLTGAKPGFDVPHADAMVKSRKRADHRRGRVALSQHPVGPFSAQHNIKLRQSVGRDLGQRLIGTHYVQVMIGPDVEQRENLVEHPPMLRGDADDAGEMVRMTLEFLDHRSHFDGFRASAEDREEFHIYPATMIRLPEAS